jgi:hypothetical protein
VSPATSACRDAIAVLLGDPEDQSAEARLGARVHAGMCARCASVLDDPDASRRVLDTLARRRSTGSTVVRGALVVLAVAQFTVACPWLFGASLVPDQHVALDHLTRDGALDLVVATAGLLVVWRSRYAIAAALVGAIVFAAQFATGLVDQHDRHVNAAFELTHLLAVGVLALVVVTAFTARRATPMARRVSHTLRSL